MGPLNEKQEAEKLARLIEEEARALEKKINIMEICGTHTMAVSGFGIRGMLPENINLISGPGCPVCVTPVREIDTAIEISKKKNVIMATFGDMMRVPGTKTTLGQQRAKGEDIRVVYSPLDAVSLAEKNPQKEIVFIGIGFETTSPSIAAAVSEAKHGGVDNFFVLPWFKRIIPPMEALLKDNDINVHGFLAPGHVSAITGGKIYEGIAKKYKAPCVVAGFEALDILTAVLMICRQAVKGGGEMEIQYKRAVNYEGNKTAAAFLDEVFEPIDSEWRGLGMISKSGLSFSEQYSGFNAEKRYGVDVSYSKEPAGCRCGDVLKGLCRPDECPLFAKNCTPGAPVGACMVSSEGACAAYYKYNTI